MEGICGRMCDACTWKERLDCPGCQDGPGRRFSGGCPIADCAGRRAYGMCDLHLFYRLCPAAKRYAPEPAVGRGGRAGAPGAAGPECPCAGQVAVALFWLVTPSVFSNILTMDTVAGAFPTAGVVGNVLAFLISLAYGVLFVAAAGGGRPVPHGGPVLFGWRHHQRCLCRFRQFRRGTGCGGCSPCRSWCWSSVPHIRSFMPMQRFWRSLTRSWRGSGGRFGNGGSASLLGLFGCIFLALISAILGLLAILADAIGLLVVGIVKLVYLYRTAKRFREYQPAALQKEVL